MQDERREKIKEFEKIVKELDKIIKHLEKKKDEELGEDKKKLQKREKNLSEDDCIELINKDIPRDVQVAKIYREFYSDCIKKLKKYKTGNTNCEPSYEDFYKKMYLYDKENLDSYIKTKLNNNIKSSIKEFKRKISEFYNSENLQGNAHFYILDFCECESNTTKKMCLCIKEKERIVTEDSVETVNYSDGERILFRTKKIGIAFLSYFFGIFTPLGLAAVVSFYYILTYIVYFFVASPKSKTTASNIIDIYTLIFIFAVFLVVSFIEMFKDYSRLFDGPKKVALSNITKLSLFPFLFFKERGLINVFNKSIVAYEGNDKTIIASIFDVQCPICDKLNYKNKLVAKSEKGDVIFECEGERLHRFNFDKALKKGERIQ